jgi:dUTP pyrophosphatase
MDRVPLPVQADDDVDLPFYASSGASGADVKAKISDNLVIEPGESKIVPTGLRFEIPEGYEIQVRPRSGLAAKEQVTVLNTPGTIDSDYRGELLIILINHGKKPFVVTPGMRIAQIVLAPVVQAVFHRQEILEATIRGEGKFGHTGTH